MCNLKILTSILWMLLTINSTWCLCYEERNTNTTDDSFKHLRSCLTSNGVKAENIIQRNSGAEYTELNWQWNTLNGYVGPMAYLVAKETSDVQNAIKCCRSLKIRPVARSGGHSFTKDSYGDHRSLVIDVGGLNQLSIDPVTMSSDIGAGCRNGFIHYNLWNKGKFMLPMGTCPYFGIGGHALGGGHGSFSRSLGLTTDNIIELEMVDAEGNLRTINNSTNTNLFWALRGGGGGSLGIVTKFKFRIYSAPKYILSAYYYYDFNDFPQFFHAWQSFITSDQPDTLGTYLKISDTEITMQMQNVNWRKESKANFEEILSSFGFPRYNKSSINVLTYPEFLVARSDHYFQDSSNDLSEIAELKKYNFVGYFYYKSFYVDKVAKKDDISKLHALLKNNVKVINPNSYAVVFIQQYGGAINKFSKSETAFVHRGKTLYNVLLKVHSTNDTYSKSLTDATKNLFEESKKCLKHKESYINYVDGEQIPLKRYYGTNLKRLVQVKMRTDPENIFCNPHSIPTTFSNFL